MFCLVYLPHGCSTIDTHWLFKLKQLASGLDDHHKVQWVVKGYSQIYGLDFSKTYAPVVRLKNLRLLLTIAMAFGLHIHTMDVKSAFLHMHLIEQIYV
jgi:hypothetical protein